MIIVQTISVLVLALAWGGAIVLWWRYIRVYFQLARAWRWNWYYIRATYVYFGPPYDDAQKEALRYEVVRRGVHAMAAFAGAFAATGATIAMGLFS